jgi:RNA-binding protein
MAADALAARELIKVHVLENSLLGIREAAEELAEKTNSQVVIVIGNRFVLYKRSDKNLCEM